MNYDGPKELADKSGWHYGTSNRRSGTHAIGYCAEHAPHATELEARECYGQYQRDHVRLREHSSSWSDCNVDNCKNPARNIAEVEGDGFLMAVLCDDHFTAEHAITAMHLDGPANDSIHS